MLIVPILPFCMVADASLFWYALLRRKGDAFMQGIVDVKLRRPLLATSLIGQYCCCEGRLYFWSLQQRQSDITFVSELVFCTRIFLSVHHCTTYRYFSDLTFHFIAVL